MYAHVSTPFLDRVRPRIILLSTWIPIKLMQCVSAFCFRWKWTSSCLATPTKILTSFLVGLLGTLLRTTSGHWLVYLFTAVAKENFLLYFLLKWLLLLSALSIAFYCYLLYWDLFAIFVSLLVIHEKVLITENRSSFSLAMQVLTTLS